MTIDLIMKKTILILMCFALFFGVGCSEKDDSKPSDDDVSTIIHEEFHFEAMCFEDVELFYNFNDDQANDYWLDLKWDFDTLGIDYFTTIERKHGFYDHAGSYSDFNNTTYSEWAVGDTVVKTDENEHGWISQLSGSHAFGSNNAESYYQQLDILQNKETYWAFFLKRGDALHYGWMRVRCYLVEEYALNLKPDEPILIGQRE